MDRLSWDEYFMLMAEFVANRSTCTRRQVGCVIVSPENRILTTGYNGAPSGVRHCLDVGCPRENYPSGLALHLCVGTHAEANAIANAARHGIQLKNATAYCTILPCQECLKSLINAGIKTVKFLGQYNIEAMALYERIVKESGIKMEKVRLK